MLKRLFLVVFLAGCAAKNVDKGYVPSPDKAEGILILSVSQDRKPGSYNATVMVYLGDAPGPFTLIPTHKVIESREKHLAMFDFKPTELEGVYGRLHVINVPAGKHKLSSWQIFNGHNLRIFPKQRPDPIVFELKPGEVKYLGNLHGNLNTGDNLLGMAMTGGGYVEVRDERVRDLAVFEKRHPDMKGKATVAISRVGPWLKTAETGTQIDPPAPVVQPVR